MGKMGKHIAINIVSGGISVIINRKKQKRRIKKKKEKNHRILVPGCQKILPLLDATPAAKGLLRPIFSLG